VGKLFGFGQYVIDTDDTYFLAYGGGRRGLLKQDQADYDKAISLPWEAQRSELKRLGHTKNPNVVPISGKDLIELIREKNMVPFFDQFFEQSHLLQVNDVLIFESMRAKSYDLLLGK